GLATGDASPFVIRNTGLISSMVAAYACSLFTRPDRRRNSNVWMVAQILARSATSRARRTTSSMPPPAAAHRAASAATNPSAIEAFNESTTSTRPSNCTAANNASWCDELIDDATVTHTISRWPVFSYASRKSAGDGVDDDATAECADNRW